MSVFGPFAFDVPAQFAAQFATGEIARYGAILKNVGTGQIVGHLQETSSIASFLSRFPSALSPVNMLSSLASNYQIFRVSQQVDALQTLVEGVRALQLANLAMGALGIGVTIAGFVHLSGRLNALDDRIDSIDSKLNDILNAIQQLQKAQALSDIKKCNNKLSAGLKSVDSARKMMPSMRDSVLSRVADDMMILLEVYPNEIVDFFNGQPSPDVIKGLIGSYSVAAALRVQCLLMVDENESALDDARRLEREANLLFDSFTYFTVRRMIETDERIGDGQALEDQTLVTLMAVREVQDMIASRALLVERLVEKGVSGREYMEAVRQRNEPLLIVRPA